MQTMFFSDVFALRTAAVQTNVPAPKSGPVELGASLLVRVAGGLGPNGTWAAQSTTLGPNGTW